MASNRKRTDLREYKYTTSSGNVYFIKPPTLKQFGGIDGVFRASSEDEFVEEFVRHAVGYSEEGWENIDAMDAVEILAEVLGTFEYQFNLMTEALKKASVGVPKLKN